MKNKTQYFTINIVIMLVLISFSPISTLSIKIEKTTLKNTKNNVDESSSLILSNTIEDAISLNIKDIKKQSDLYKYQNKSSKTININFDTSKARIDPRKNGGVYLYLEGTTPSGSPGEPMIPMKSIKLELPKNSKILEIAMTDVEYKKIKNKLLLTSVPKPLFWNAEDDLMDNLSNVTNKNFKIYNSMNIYPGDILSYRSGDSKDKKIVIIQIYPLQYIPRTGEAYLIIKGKLHVFYEETNSLSITSTTNTQNLIITPPMLYQNAQILKNYHNGKGIETDIINTTWIYRNIDEAADPPYDGFKNESTTKNYLLSKYNYTLAKKIINYLKNETDHPRLTYVTLLGNAELIPPSYYYCSNINSSDIGSWVPTDFFYSSPDYDLVPNYYVGRLPVDNPEQANHVINKIINWEGTTDLFSNITISGGKPFNTPYFIGEMICIDSVNNNYFKGSKIKKQFQTEKKFTKENFLDALKNDDTGIIYNIAHGSGALVAFEETSPLDKNCYLTADEILDLPKKSKTPIVVSIACSNGAYDADIVDHKYNISFGEALLLSDGGGIAYIGGSRTNAGTPIFTINQGNIEIYKESYMAGLLTYFFKGYYKGLDTLGQLTGFSYENFAMENNMTDYMVLFNFFSFVLLGDPALKIPDKPVNDFNDVPVSYEKNPVGFQKYSENGTIPITVLEEPTYITSYTNSSSVNIKMINPNNDLKYILESSNRTTINDKTTFDLTFNTSDYYLIKTCTDDGKEGWFYTHVFRVVDDDFDESTPGYDKTKWSKIQDAIDNSNPGDGIYVFNGTYNENIKIDKPLILIGENRETTIINAQKKRSAITINKNFIGSIQSFTIENSGILPKNAGIKIESKLCFLGLYDTNIINNNKGILLNPSRSCSITFFIQHNKISNNKYGFYLNSKNKKLLSINVIYGNQIDNNTYGLYLLGTKKNIIISNDLVDNRYGIFLKNSRGNYILMNNFIQNKIHAFFVNSKRNTWFLNYWDNWIGLKYSRFEHFPKFIHGRIGLLPSKDVDRFPCPMPIYFYL